MSSPWDREDRLILKPEDGKTAWLEDILGIRFMLAGDETGGTFALVEHPVNAPRTTGPMHSHANEDEYSYVAAGDFEFMIGDRLIPAGPGSLIFKPRAIPHTFWLTSEGPGKILEIISPAGFEHYFEELAELADSGEPPNLAKVIPLWQRYGMTMHVETFPELLKRNNLRAPAALAPFVAAMENAE